MTEKNRSLTQTEKRKNEHIGICLGEDVQGRVTTGFEQVRFCHQALPELDFAQIRTDTEFLGKRIRMPFLVSSMTGGTRETGGINWRLAETAERRGWAMGIGSVRAALESPEAAETFRLRKVAPTIPLLANLGAVQLNCGWGADECRRAVELTEADGLVLHLNGLQEVFQPEGDTDFSGLLARIESLCKALPVPVGVKEVGWGIDGETARRLFEAGVSFIDAAGAGGTSWSQVEKFRSPAGVRRLAADAFADWGIPTAACIRSVRASAPHGLLIGSGGLRSGVDAAKAIALGADLAGFGRSLLAPAADSDEDRLESLFEQLELELRAAMFGIGAADIDALKSTDRLLITGL